MIMDGVIDHIRPLRVYNSVTERLVGSVLWQIVSCHSLFRSVQDPQQAIVPIHMFTLHVSSSSESVRGASATFVRAGSSYVCNFPRKGSADLRYRNCHVREPSTTSTSLFEIVRGCCRRHWLTVPLPGTFSLSPRVTQDCSPFSRPNLSLHAPLSALL